PGRILRSGSTVPGWIFDNRIIGTWMDLGSLIDEAPPVSDAGDMTAPGTATVLADAARAAGAAPSVHNTQPWRWRVYPDRLDLFADRSRQLTVADPDGRLLTVSCGAALHHARVALVAAGWLPQVE